MLLDIENNLRQAIHEVLFDRLTMKKDTHITELTKDEVVRLIEATCKDDVTASGALHSTDYLEDVGVPELNYRLVQGLIEPSEYHNIIAEAMSEYYHGYILREFEDFLECEYVATEEDIH